MFQHGGNVQSSACQVFEKNMIFRDREEIAYSIALYSSPMKEKNEYYPEGQKILLLCTVVGADHRSNALQCLKSDSHWRGYFTV